MFPSLDVFVGVLDHDHRRVDHGADGDGDAAQRHDVGVDPLQMHQDERREHAERQGQDRDQRRAGVPQEQPADDRHDHEFLDQLRAEVFDRAIDEFGPVVDRNHLHTRRQAGLQRFEPVADRRDNGPRIAAGAEDHHPADHLALAVELGDPAAHLRPDLDGGDVAELDGNAAGRRPDRDGAKVVQLGQVAVGADHVFGFRQLEHGAAGLRIALPYGLHHLLMGHAEGGQLHRIEDDLILPDHAADGGDLCHAGHGLQLVAQEPVLQTAKLRQIVPADPVDQGVFVDPAHPGRVGAQGRPRRLGQSRLDLTEVFENPRPGPVEVRPLVEQDIDVAVAEERIPPHRAGAGHRQHGRGQGIGDLVLDNLRRLAGIGGPDNDLDVRQVGQGVDRRAAYGPKPARQQGERGQQDEDPRPDRRANDRGDHRAAALRVRLRTVGSPSAASKVKSTWSPIDTP